MQSLIVIPARFGSTRLPGKPLVNIAGQTMLSRVVTKAKAATSDNTHIVVATDDERIAKHCDAIEVKWVMTARDCLTGTDRVRHAVNLLDEKYDFIINLQGDAPFTPPEFIKSLLDEAKKDKNIDMLTPVTQLSWQELDELRQNKLATPFSGTTVCLDNNNNALWFSKNIIPAIRAEEKLRDSSILSPVYRHIGLYGYSYSLLEKFVSLPESTYEKLEGLEQLRVLENGYKIRCVKVDYGNKISMSGIDSPEDVERAERILRNSGESL